MNKELTFVPASKMGPHYTDSGKRPIHSEMFQPVIVQLDSGYVGPAIWARDPEDHLSRFTFLSTSMVAINPAPVCWWHLPQAVPNTERGWFADNMERLGYDVDECFRQEDYYEHWVASGRP